MVGSFVGDRTVNGPTRKVTLRCAGERWDSGKDRASCLDTLKYFIAVGIALRT